MQGRRPKWAWIDLTPSERIARLMKKVIKRPDGCWEWTAERFKNVYGQVCIRFGPSNTKYCLAHRLMWELHNGPLGNKKALHKCDHPWCIRPSHLFKGTTLDNALDMHRKGRANPAYGERSGNAKLTASKVRAMRLAHSKGAKHRELAARFGVSQKQVSVIINRIQWGHI